MDESPTQKVKLSLKEAVTLWCQIKGVGIPEFQEKMNYTYQHAWGLLRGEREFTDAALGGFVKSFGTEAAREVLVMCGLEDDERLSVLERPNDAAADPDATPVLALDVPARKMEPK